MSDKRFTRPVRIRLGAIRDVTSPRQAIDVLLSVHWPGECGHKHHEARDICLKALDGYRSAAEARHAFIEAAREADILVDG